MRVIFFICSKLIFPLLIKLELWTLFIYIFWLRNTWALFLIVIPCCLPFLLWSHPLRDWPLFHKIWISGKNEGKIDPKVGSVDINGYIYLFLEKEKPLNCLLIYGYFDLIKIFNYMLWNIEKYVLRKGKWYFISWKKILNIFLKMIFNHEFNKTNYIAHHLTLNVIIHCTFWKNKNN